MEASCGMIDRSVDPAGHFGTSPQAVACVQLAHQGGTTEGLAAHIEGERGVSGALIGAERHLHARVDAFIGLKQVAVQQALALLKREGLAGVQLGAGVTEAGGWDAQWVQVDLLTQAFAPHDQWDGHGQPCSDQALLERAGGSGGHRRAPECCGAPSSDHAPGSRAGPACRSA